MPIPALVPAPAPAIEPEIERVIGEATAAAAAALAQALTEHWSDGGLSFKAKKTGGDLVAELWKLRQGTLGELDFESVAREQGRRALAARCNGGGYPATQGDILIDETLRILNQVTATMRAAMK